MFLNAVFFFFFNTVPYKYGKKIYSTVQVIETHTFLTLRTGEVSFCTNCRNSFNEKALPPRFTKTIYSIDLE